jgi:hypothetical protein
MEYSMREMKIFGKAGKEKSQIRPEFSEFSVYVFGFFTLEEEALNRPMWVKAAQISSFS